jgi:hypothetical protein
MNKVFILHHVHETEDIEDIKLIGVYSSEENAQAAILRLSQQSGFVDHPDGFQISRYDLDKDNWTEGFITFEKDQ